MPRELYEARLVWSLCQQYHALPSDVLDQRADILAMHSILHASGDFEATQ